VRVLVPSSVQQACALLAESPSAMPIAGGTDLLVHWPVNLKAHEQTYVDLSGLVDLRRMTWTESSLVLGGLTTYWDVLCDQRAGHEFPLLWAAARQVGAIQIQSRGTWAGNIVNASPAADGVPVLMAYDAVVVLTSVKGSRRVALHEFYTGYKQMARRPDELLTAIELPRRGACDVSIFEKVGPRRAQAITKVGFAAVHSAAGWRVVANSVAPTVVRCRAVEALLEKGSRANGPGHLLPALARDVAPIDDIRSTAEYRRNVLARLLYHDLFGPRENAGRKAGAAP
jgi:CO/xanthine dehydrogenase FAD-binding subunit